MRKFLIILLSLFSYIFISAQPLDTCISTTIYYEINSTNFVEDSNFYTFINKQVPFTIEHLNDLKVIKITGSSSLDGPYKKNRELAVARAQKIQKILHVDDDAINIANEGIERLYVLINNSNEPWKDSVISVILNSDDVEKDLKKLKCWNEIKNKYLPLLRYTRVEMHFCSPQIIETIKYDTIYSQKPVYFRDTIIIRPNPKVIPILAFKSNILSNLIVTPNIQAELYTHIWGLSIEFDYTFPWYHKDYDSYFYYQILNGTVGIRKYINNSYTRHWIGVYGNTAIYDICFWDKNKGWQGELYGVGVGYGYVFQSKKHMRFKFEPYIRIGWFNTKYDTYHASQPWNEKYYYNWYLRASDFIPRRFNMNYFGPTEIGFNLTYDLICLKRCY